MKTLSQWLQDYGVSHQHPLNKRLHWWCVPTIFFVIFGMVRYLPQPDGFGFFSWAALILLAVLAYYAYLSRPLAIGFAVWALIVWGGNEWLLSVLGRGGLFGFSLGVFVVAWVGQFIGHAIEGKKPSFFQDLQFLLIGPAWLMVFVYQRLGIKV